jgi:FkbM family methyltransferase
LHPQINQRFSRNPKILVHAVGLASKDCIETIALQADGSSVFRPSDAREKIQLVDAVRFFEEHDIQHINLMKINIEGGEYELLEHLLQTGFIKNIENIQVQFHQLTEGYAERMSAIQKSLSQTHSLTYQYPMVWENWQRSL